MNSTYVLIDIGSQMLRMAVIENHEEWVVRALAMREGLFMEQGRILSTEGLTQSLMDLKREIEEKLNFTLIHAIVNISGGDVLSLNHHESLPLKKPRIKDYWVQKLIRSSRHKIQDALGHSRHLIHLIEQIRNLKTESHGEHFIQHELNLGVHGIAVSRKHHQDLEYCLRKAKLKVEGWIFNGLAAAAALKVHQQKSSFCVVDIGAQTCDYTVFHAGHVFLSGSFLWGGQQITAHLAQHFHLSRLAVERLKRSYPSLSPSFIKENELIAEDEAFSLRQRISKHSYCKELSQQYMIIADEIKNVLTQKSILPHYKMDFILSGSASQVKGLKELFASHLQVPVHLADYYHWSEKIPPEYRSQTHHIHLFGMMLYATQNQYDYSWNHLEKKGFSERIRFFKSFI